MGWIQGPGSTLDHSALGLRFGGQCLVLSVQGPGLGAWGLEFTIQESGCKVQGWCIGFRALGLGFGVWGLGFGVWGLGFGVQEVGFRVWGFEIWVRRTSSFSIDGAVRSLPMRRGPQMVSLTR